MTSTLAILSIVSLLSWNIVTSAGSHSGTDHQLTLESGGHSRSAVLHLPPLGSFAGSLPLVTVLHTMAEDPSETASLTGFSDLADSEGFAVVYPRGLAKANLESWLPSGIGYTWNAGACCPKACADKVDDVQFMKDLIRHLSEHIAAVSAKIFDLDMTRLYLAGGSNGGFMTNRIGCQAPGLFAAIAPGAGPIAENASHVWGSDPYECPPLQQPLPALYFHGTSDELVWWNGNPLLNFPSVESYVQRMRVRNGVEGSPGVVSYKHGDVLCTAYGEKQFNFTFCKHSAGHCWPGREVQGPCTMNIDATSQMWAFFKKYKLTGSTSSIVV